MGVVIVIETSGVWRGIHTKIENWFEAKVIGL